MDEELCVQQINRAACALFNLKQPSDISLLPGGAHFKPGRLHGSHGHRHPGERQEKYLAEYGKYVSESIVYDKEYRIIFSIMRDITEEETRTAERAKITERTVEITNDVIESRCAWCRRLPRFWARRRPRRKWPSPS